MSEAIIKTSLYLSKELKKKVEIHCINHEFATVNSFVLKAIEEKLERDGSK